MLLVSSRANLAHEHPIDVDSSPSSPSSGIPSFLDARRRPKSASRHRSRTTADDSSSSHLLARLVSREEELREINAALVVTSERLEGEASRANAAERRALDYFHRLRTATESRERAEQESARLREELKLYKLQLENAQKEIFRAQDIIDQVASQRNEAEADAARARTKARKLQEEKLVMLAREEGRRMGYKEGLSIGRRIGYDEGRGRRLTGPSDRLPHYPLSLEDHNGDENGREQDEVITDDEPSDPRSHIRLRSAASTRQQPIRSESAPPVRTFDIAPRAPPLPVPSRVDPVRVRTPSRDQRTPSSPDEPETIHPIPIPIRPSPILPTQQINVPHDGWIPTADSRTSYILVPPPHELQQPIPTTPSSVATEIQDGRPTNQQEPPPVRTRDYAYQGSVPAPIKIARTSSLTSHTSTHISQYDLVNKRPGSSLRNEIYIGRPRSGSQRSRDSVSRNDHDDRESRYSDRTEAETIVEQWRADSDGTIPPKNLPRSSTPAARPHRPSDFYYRPREIVMPSPLGDVGADTRARTPVSTEHPATRPQSPPDDPAASHPTRARSPLEYFRQRFRQRPSSGSSIPNIVVESPSEPETNLSPSATIAAQPELLSPEAANRPLPQDESHQHQHQHHHHHPHHHHPSQSRSQPQHHHRGASSTYDTATRSGTPSSPWPAGFVPYGSGPGQGTGTTSKSASERDRRHHHRVHPDPVSDPNRSSSQQGQSASTYEAAPLPVGVTYPAPPVRPHTSHRHYKDKERERERDRGGDRVRDRDRRREYERDRDRDREQDREDTGLDEELTRSPAPLQRPISLFDSDEGER
ncbi:hypothetical protein J3R82DRAFT_5142 [Butyriboletus roseoflavus]|nr:hypothetical protein J3R82DRAFT_5142 [Butyriboletus roseoflavus]